MFVQFQFMILYPSKRFSSVIVFDTMLTYNAVLVLDTNTRG